MFATAAADELVRDIGAYKKKLETIAQIADALGVNSEIVEVSLNLKSPEAPKE